MSIKDIQTQLGVTADGVWGEQSKSAMRQAMQDEKSIMLSKDISLNEMLFSNTANQHGIDNMPDQRALEHLIEATINCFQPIQDELGFDCDTTSGYRCPKVNTLVGSKQSSAHLVGYARDFRCPKFGTPGEVVDFLAKRLKQKGIKFDQLIIENRGKPYAWVHIGYKNQGGLQRGKVMSIVT